MPEYSLGTKEVGAFMNRIVMKNAFMLFILLSTQIFAQTQISTVTELKAAMRSGGDFVLAAGDFALNEAVVINTDFSLQGADKDETSLVLRGAPAGIEVSGAISLALQDLTLHYVGSEFADVLWVHDAKFSLERVRLTGGVFGENDEGAEYGVGLYVTGKAKGELIEAEIIANADDGLSAGDSAHLVVDKTVFKNNADDAISLWGNASLEMQDSSIEANNIGTWFSESAQASIVSSQFIGNQTNVILIADQARVSLTGSLITKNGFSEGTKAIRMIDQSHLVLEDNDILDNALGVFETSGEATALVQNNRVTNNNDAVQFGTSSTFIARENAKLEFLDNVVSNEASNAFNAWDNAVVTVSGNSFKDISWFVNDRRQPTVIFQDNVEAIFENNKIIDSLNRGVVITANAKVTSSGNSITDSDGHGVQIYGSSTVTMTNDTVSSNGGVGLYVYDEASLNITKSRINDNTTGINIENQALVTVQSSSLENNSSIAVHAKGTASLHVRESKLSGSISGLVYSEQAFGTISMTTISNNAQSGFVVNGQAKPSFSNNQVLNNGVVGLFFRDQTLASAANNTIEGSPYGIFVSEDAKPELLDNTFIDVETELGTGERPY